MSLIPTKYLVAFFYAISLVLIGVTFVVAGGSVWSPIIVGLILLAGAASSRTSYGLVKRLPVSVSAMIWVVASIILAFLPYLFNFTTLQYMGYPVLLWTCIGVSIVNLVAILLGKMDAEESVAA